MMLRRFGLIALCSLPLAALAADSPGPGGDSPRRLPAVAERRWRANEEAEWERALAFFEKNSPNRWAAFSNLHKEQQDKLRPLLFMRYRGILWLERDGQKQLLVIKEKQIQTEDRIFKIRQDLMVEGLTLQEIDRLKGTLREQVRDLVRLRTAERAERIAQLEAILENEKKSLQKARDSEESLVEKQYQNELSGGPPGIASPPSHRRGPEAGGSPNRRRDGGKPENGKP